MKRTNTLLMGLMMGMGTVAFGQDLQQNPPAPAETTTPGWHRFGERGTDAVPQGQGPQSEVPQAQAPQAPQPTYAMPTSINIPAGTWVTVRVNQPLSSDRNQPGDAFTATLVEPIISQGLVVARRGQTVGGRVSLAEKAGRVKGTAKLGVELTELSLADGQQLPIKTQFIERRGDTSVGRDVGAVGVTTGLGAAIGAAAGGGWGAGIGALAGAAAGTTGVLATRGVPSVIYPESVLTFRLEQPITVTSQAMQAFQPSSQEDYGRPAMRNTPPPPAYRTAPYPAVGAYPYYPYYPSAGFYFYSRPGYFYGRGYYGGRRW